MGGARLRLRDGLNVLNRKDASTAQKLLSQMLSTSTADLPAVELHMFPDEPSDVESQPEVEAGILAAGRLQVVSNWPGL